MWTPIFLSELKNTSGRAWVHLAGVFLVIAGVVLFIQGIDVLPGDPANKQTQRVVFGALTFLFGLRVLWQARRMSRNR